MSERVPKPVEQLAAACEGFFSSKGIRKARWRLFHRLKELGWTVEVIESVRQADGSYTRRATASVIVSYPQQLAVEISKRSLTQRQLERLGNSHGIKVAVLIWGRELKPWDDPRGDWRAVTLDDIEGIDYIITAGSKPPLVHTAKSLKADQAAETLQRELSAKARAQALELAILETIEAAWKAREPVSTDAKAGPERHLPTLLQHKGFTPKETRAAVQQLQENGVIERAKHRYTWLRGLRIKPRTKA